MRITILAQVRITAGMRSQDRERPGCWRVGPDFFGVDSISFWQRDAETGLRRLTGQSKICWKRGRREGRLILPDWLSKPHWGQINGFGIRSLISFILSARQPPFAWGWRVIDHIIYHHLHLSLSETWTERGILFMVLWNRNLMSCSFSARRWSHKLHFGLYSLGAVFIKKSTGSFLSSVETKRRRRFCYNHRDRECEIVWKVLFSVLMWAIGGH